jgi:hypothetical protein
MDTSSYPRPVPTGPLVSFGAQSSRTPSALGDARRYPLFDFVCQPANSSRADIDRRNETAGLDVGVDAAPGSPGASFDLREAKDRQRKLLDFVK